MASAGTIAAAGSVVVRSAHVAPMGARSVVLQQFALGSPTVTVVEIRAADATLRNVWLAALRSAAGTCNAAPTAFGDWLEAAIGSRKLKAHFAAAALELHRLGIVDRLAQHTLHHVAAASFSPALEVMVTSEADRPQGRMLVRARVGLQWSTRHLAPRAIAAFSSALWHVIVAAPSLAAHANVTQPPAPLLEAKVNTDDRQDRSHMALDAYLQATVDYVRNKPPLRTIVLEALGLRSTLCTFPSAAVNLLVGAAAP
jgi:hypothetical protein